MRSRSKKSGDDEEDRSAGAGTTRRSIAARTEVVHPVVPARGHTAGAGRQTARLGAFEELGQLARILNERERGRDAE